MPCMKRAWHPAMASGTDPIPDFLVFCFLQLLVCCSCRSMFCSCRCRLFCCCLLWLKWLKHLRIRVPLQEAARNAHIAQNKIPWHSKRIHGVQGQESDRTLCRLQGLNHSIPDAGGQSGGWPLNSRLRRAYSMRRFSRTQCILPVGRVEEGMERWMMGYGGAHSSGDQETSWDG